MRVIKVLGSLVVLACVTSAVAADKQVPEKQVLAQNDVVVAKKASARTMHAAVKPAATAKSGDEGDSRLNDYALERSSCCGPN
jgi:hypothetical protein